MGYDNDILIENIRQLMKTNNITQNDLQKISGAQQSRISNCLNGRGDFTTPQLVAIASHFNVSLDDLLGLKRETKKGTSYETYSDIFRLLFSLGDLLDITIKDMRVSDIHGYSNLSPFYDEKDDPIIQRAVSFDDEVIMNVLNEWRSILEARRLTDGELLYGTWKQGIFSKYNFKIESQSSDSTNDAKSDTASSTQSDEW